MKMYRPLLIILIAAIISCSKSTEKEHLATPYTYAIVDSIPLFTENEIFPFYNIEKIEKDSVLGFNYPQLNLTLFDTTGKVKTSITKKGTLKENFQGVFVDPVWLPNGELLVFEHGNSPIISHFDKDFKFVKRMKLLNELYPYFFSTITSRAMLMSHDKAGYKIVANISNQSLAYNSPRYYKDSYSFVELQFDNDLNYVGKKFIIKYDQFAKVKEAIEKDEKSWDSPASIYGVDHNNLYVKYEFDNNVYKFNSDYTLVDTIALQLPSFPESPQSFRPISDLNKSIKQNYELRYSRPHFSSMALKDNKIFLVFLEPIEEDEIPSNINEERDFNFKSVLQVVSLDKQDNQKFTNLDARISPYTRVWANNSNQVFISNDTRKYENTWVYKVSLGKI